MRTEQKIFNDLIETTLKNSSNNEAVITNVKLWAESWQKEMNQALTIPVVVNFLSCGKNLTLLETIENTKQLPQVQYNLQRQLRELRVMSNKLGLYDAADFLTSYCG